MSRPADPRRTAAGDRGRGLRLLWPLRQRDFALLWTGMTVSLLGDGIYFVAIAWQAYSLSNAPTALSVVGVAWTLPTVMFLLVGGAISDRFDRRRVLVAANLAEALAIAAIGALAVSGDLRLWMLLVLVGVYGAGVAFFNPAFEAIVPTLIAQEDVAAASALDHFVRPMSLQLLGPALGGLLVALIGTGVAFLVDAASFLASVATLLMMRNLPPIVSPVRSVRSTLGEIADGFHFVRANPWLWGTLSAACLSLLAYWGPLQVLLPYLVKNDLHAGGGEFGAIRAAGGLGAIVAAAAVAQAGLPRRCVTWMFGVWALQSAALIGYALAGGAWIYAVISLVAGSFGAVGNIIWGTLMKTLVPNDLLGRVSSFDWLVSIGLIPVSFAITGPIANAVGPKLTLIGAGGLAAVAIVAFLAVPGLHDPERMLARSAGADEEPPESRLRAAAG